MSPCLMRTELQVLKVRKILDTVCTVIQMCMTLLRAYTLKHKHNGNIMCITMALRNRRKRFQKITMAATNKIKEMS